MKGSKILATIVVLAMIFSTVIVLERLDVKVVDKASAIPGIDTWGYTTDELEYNEDKAVNITIDCRNLTADTRYYIYYPRYWRTGASTYNLTWRPYLESSVHKSFKVPASGANTTLSNIILNRSGIWAFSISSYGGTDTIKGNSWANWNATADGWFWVNTSTMLSLAVSPDEVYFGQNQTITLTVRKGGASSACWMDIRREIGALPPIPTASIGNFPLFEADGIYSFSSNWQGVMQWAGNYSVLAFSDLDGDDSTPNYQYHNAGYNSTFGDNPSISAGFYNYAVCGPWDPPEYNSTYYANKLVQNPGEPTTSIPEGNQTMYWGFDGQVNISVKNYDGENISGLSIKIYNSDDEDITSSVDYWVSRPTGGSRYSWIWINNSNTATATTGGWGRDGSGAKFGVNGTWYAYIWSDVDGDLNTSTRTGEEWNATVEWTVASAPASQWKWIDDDGSLSSDNSDGVIPYIPDITQQPINLQFQIINDEHQYYGDTATSDALAPKEKGENITISGDALFLSDRTLDKLPGASYSSGTWTLPITPTMAMNGGELLFSCKWKGNGTVSTSLSIGGPKLNGTIVTISPSEFTIDDNVTITVTVHNQGYAIPNAQVWLNYIYDSNRTLVTGPGQIEYRNGGGSFDGEYEFLFNRTQQTTNQTNIDWDGDGSIGDSSAMAPRNISAYVKYYRGGTPTWIYGYAKATMKPRNDFKVSVEPDTVMAGQKIKKIYFNTTIIDDTGNSTGWPKDTGLKVRVYNSTGHDVTATIGSLSTSDTDGMANKTASNEYFQKPGTYTVHAFNNTHNSEGYNATFTIVPVDVMSSLSEFIWGVDENISSTFTVTYDGKPINGTLRIDNMSEQSTYNKTWTNCSFAPTIGSTSGGDASSVNSSKEVKVTNGGVTIFNITANNLSEYLSQSTPKWYHYSMQNITFYFKPDIAGSAWARASGSVPVKIADVDPTPKSLVYNKPATLTLSVTGRGTGLGGVWTSIIIPGLTGEMNTTTSADGKATFSFTPPTTGKIKIKIENRTSSTVVYVRAWALYLDVETQANEGITFTATVRNGSAAGAAVPDATVTFNRVSKTTDSSGQVTFDAPSVVATREYTMVAMKEGFAEDSEIIYILNIPRLMIVVQGEVTAGATFDVIIADDTGNPVVGAVITVNERTYTTGANGIATITAPSEAGDYIVTATFPGYTDAEPLTITIKSGGIPGFELLTLIAAIGVAFILLRRKKH